ncbi:putative aspartate aminotransferase, cytoplasmic 2 [Lissotriton helveticus]
MAAVRKGAPCCPSNPGSKLPGPLSLFTEVPEDVGTAVERLLTESRSAVPPQGTFIMGRVCQDDDGQPWVPTVVKKAWLQITNDPTLNHEYLPALGNPEFCRAALELAIGKDSTAVLENRASGIQTPGGSAAIWIGAVFLHRWYNARALNGTAVYISELTWGSHRQIFEEAGFTEIRSYRYWDNEKLMPDVKGLMDDLENAPDFSIVFLDCSMYNPTGIGLASNEWEWISEMAMRKNLLPFFHVPAQGLISGDPDLDSGPVQFFAEKGLELFCAQSFSRNFGLYDARVGNLIIVTKQKEAVLSSRSQLEKLVKGAWGSPPALGARVVATILNNPTLYAEWKEDLRAKVEHTILVREKIKEELRIIGALGNWDHITEQAGIYNFLGLNPSQVEFLIQQRNIYLYSNGQFNISWLNHGNLDYVLHSIKEAVAENDQNH